MLESINKQTAIQNIQVILIDDGSNLEMRWTDLFLSQHLCCKYKFIQNDINLGVGPSRRKIFNLVDTDYFCFLDSDDIFYSDTIIE